MVEVDILLESVLCKLNKEWILSGHTGPVNRSEILESTLFTEELINKGESGGSVVGLNT